MTVLHNKRILRIKTTKQEKKAVVRADKFKLCSSFLHLKKWNPDYTKGLFQAIGFKEFDKYLALDKEMRKKEKGKELLEKGREMLQIANRQYAKRQNKWIEKRFLKKNYDQVPIMYELNGTDLSKWKENVVDVAEDIVESHLAGRKPKIEPLLVEETRQNSIRVHKCEICNKFLVGEEQYQVHLKSRKHKNMCAKATKAYQKD